MRQVIRQTLIWTLNLLLPATGRHSAPTAPDRLTVHLGPWTRPWPTPTPPHARDRHTPFDDDRLSPVRPYAQLHNARRTLIYAPQGVRL